MMKKIFILGALGLVTGITSAFAGIDPFEHKFSCTFEGPAVIVKGALPLVCTAFGEFTKTILPTPVQDFDDHLTVICGNAVLYSDGVFATFPTTNTTELRSLVPGVTNITIRSLTPGVFTGPLGAILRIDIPGTPQALLTGVCHINKHNFPGNIPVNTVDSEENFDLE
jgi:hypothetical protein